jgi:NAD(P)-dependent dehydrogenase (short-subunit alcohol dehydrogenase family)
MRFRNKTCVIVGASGGIGRALVQELHSRKARVILVARSNRLSQPKGTLFVDLAKPSTINKLAATLCKTVDKIDCLFNVSGIAAYKPFLQMSQEEIKTVLNTNLSGAITDTAQNPCTWKCPAPWNLIRPART